jgi:Fur family transcriptional regulator, ferric uptake regulator
MATPDAELRSRLRDAGLRATRARLSVLQLLEGRAGPSSHTEVYTDLREGGWDRATLYRNLVDLAEAGLLRRVDLGDHVWRYELTTAPTGVGHAAEHPHFLCTRCGDVACLPMVQVSAPANVPASLLAEGVSIQFRGVCERCTAP